MLIVKNKLITHMEPGLVLKNSLLIQKSDPIYSAMKTSKIMSSIRSLTIANMTSENVVIFLTCYIMIN